MDVNKLIEEILALAEPKIRVIVTHENPDTDALVSVFALLKAYPPAKDARVVTVRSGARLEGTDGDVGVIHVDTGRGEFDQHGKSLQRTCSAAILVERLGLKDPGLKPLVELATKADNIEPIDPTSVHYQLSGWKQRFKNPDNSVDWEKVVERAFEAYEIIYDQQVGKILAEQQFRQVATLKELPNGVKLAHLGPHSNCREAAFAAGIDVVTWTQKKGNNGHYYPGVQRSRHSKLSLALVAAALRRKEADKRGLALGNKRLDYLLSEPPLEWFLHDSLAFLCCGSKTHSLTEDEFTRLTRSEFENTVEGALSRVPV